MVSFGLVLWHINHCRLFNAIHFYAYISNIRFLNTFLENIFKWALAHFFVFCTQLNGFTYFYLIRIILFTVNLLFAHRCFKYCLFNTNNLIKTQSFVSTSLNDQTVQFQTINFKVKWFRVLQRITNNSIKHHSFVYTQLYYQTVQFQTI